MCKYGSDVAEILKNSLTSSFIKREKSQKHVHSALLATTVSMSKLSIWITFQNLNFKPNI